MKKIFIFIVCLIACFSLSSCYVASYAQGYDEVYSSTYYSEVDIDDVILYGIPYYYEGYLNYYYYNGLYYYPLFWNNAWYWRPYRSPWKLGYWPHWTPGFRDYHFNPGNYGFINPGVNGGRMPQATLDSHRRNHPNMYTGTGNRPTNRQNTDNRGFDNQRNNRGFDNQRNNRGFDNQKQGTNRQQTTQPQQKQQRGSTFTPSTQQRSTTSRTFTPSTSRQQQFTTRSGSMSTPRSSGGGSHFSGGRR